MLSVRSTTENDYKKGLRKNRSADISTFNQLCIIINIENNTNETLNILLSCQWLNSDKYCSTLLQLPGKSSADQTHLHPFDGIIIFKLWLQ